MLAVVARPVDGPVHQRRFFADVLHNVNLAAFWPAGLRDVVPQHPKRGPNTLTFWDFHAGFEAAVLLGKLAERLQARGSVVAGDAVRAGVFFREHSDDQVPALLDRVLRP